MDEYLDAFVEHTYNWMQDQNYFRNNLTEQCESIINASFAALTIGFVQAGQSILVDVGGVLDYVVVGTSGIYEFFVLVDFTDLSSSNLALLALLGFNWSSGSTFCYDVPGSLVNDNLFTYLFTEELSSIIANGGISSGSRGSAMGFLEFYIEDALFTFGFQ